MAAARTIAQERCKASVGLFIDDKGTIINDAPTWCARGGS